MGTRSRGLCVVVARLGLTEARRCRCGWSGGSPGAGKGTQAEFIAAHLAVPKISTGDIFRANVSQGTPLGVEAKRYMDAGQLVPDEVTINMVRDRLAEPDAGDGFLLDGFPRTVAAGRRRWTSCSPTSASALDLVLELVVDDDEVIRRLSGRRTCRGCGKIWHVEFDADQQGASATAAAASCSSATTTRPRRSPSGCGSTRDKTAPLVDYYGAQGKLVGIDATGPVEDVTVRAIDALRSYGG